MAKNIIYVFFKDEDERSRLVEEYRYLGYYVTYNDEKITVNSVHPKKKKEKKEERERTPEREKRKSRRTDNG